MEKAVKEKKKFSYWWIIILIIAIGIWIYARNQPSQPDIDITFVVKFWQPWIYCYNDSSNVTITYDVSSSSAVDLIFTPTKEDAENLSETSQYYPSCYIPNVLKNKGGCIIAGKGCMVLLNKNIDDATVNLRYSARKIES